MRSPRLPRRPGRAAPRLLELEGRHAPAVFPVTSTGDAGPGTLRDAITQANSTPGTDNITFAIPGAGVQTIQPLSALPTITEAVTIDGSTQPGFAGNPLIEIDGSQAPNPGPGTVVDGLEFQGHTGSTVRGLVINRFSGAGIRFSAGAGGNFVFGSYIGTNAAGTAAAGNDQGVVSDTGATGGNVIGGITAADRNIISGNGNSGIEAASNDRVQGNYIGTDVTGTVAVGNSVTNGGIAVGVGGIGTTTGVQVLNNLISGNGTGGILVDGDATNPTSIIFIRGNRIGTNAAGTAALPNVGDGIEIRGATRVTVGGTVSTAVNLISGNRGSGIQVTDAANPPASLIGPVIQGNLIGTNAGGTAALPNDQFGILINVTQGTTSGVQIGGTAAGAGNLISGNTGGGIGLSDANGGTLTGTLVQGNTIGTDAAGTTRLANGNAAVNVSGTTGTTIGGTAAGAANRIVGPAPIGSLVSAVSVVGALQFAIQGNDIGVGANGQPSLPSDVGIFFSGTQTGGTTTGQIGGTAAGAGNRIAVTSQPYNIVANGSGTPPVEPNVAVLGNQYFGPADTSSYFEAFSNSGGPFPSVSAVTATAGGFTVTGNLSGGLASTSYRLEVYGTNGKLAAAQTVTTDASGAASFTATVTGTFPPGIRFGVSATPLPLGTAGTSFFSAAVGLTGGTTTGGTVTGTVFEDDGAGGTAPTQQFLQVYLDANGNNQFDPGTDPSSFVFFGGTYSLRTFTDGTFPVRIVPPNGFNQTSANPPPVTLTGGNTVSGVNFTIRDTVSRFAVADAFVGVATNGRADLTFTVTRTGNLGAAVTLAYTTADGTATAGADYVSASGTVAFAAGQKSAAVSVSVAGNGRPDVGPPRTFTLTLSQTGTPSPTVAFTDASAVGSIGIDNDPSKVAVIAGDGQSADTGTAYPVRFTVEVRNAVGNLLPGVRVLFLAAVPAGPEPTGRFGDASSTFAATGADGRATADVFTANGVPGSFAVTAIAQGRNGGQASFALTNTGPPLPPPTSPPPATVPPGTSPPPAVPPGSSPPPAVSSGGVVPKPTDPLPPARDADLVGTRVYAIAADAGGSPRVRLVNVNGAVIGDRIVFDPAFTGGVRATAPFDAGGAGPADLVVAGTGLGTAAQVVSMQLASGTILATARPFDDFAGGVFVASGIIDGRAVVAVTPDAGGGPRVRIYDALTLQPIADFFGVGDPDFRGGARTAFGDVNGDGVTDLVVTAGDGGGPRTAVFDGRSVMMNAPARLTADFFVSDPNLRTGAFVAVGDVDGDGFADVIGGAGPGGGPRVSVVSGRDLAQSNKATTLADFAAGNLNARDGVRVTAKNLDGDARADLVLGSGTGGQVTEFLGVNLLSGSPVPRDAFTGIDGFAGGVFVG